jgi:hypothetical protein
MTSEFYSLIIFYELALSLVVCPFPAILNSWGAPSIITQPFFRVFLDMSEVLCGFRCHVQNKITQTTWPKEEKTHYWIWILLRWRILCWKHRHSRTQTTRVVFGNSSSHIYEDGARWCYRKWRQSRDRKWCLSCDRKWHHRKRHWPEVTSPEQEVIVHAQPVPALFSYFISSRVVQ